MASGLLRSSVVAVKDKIPSHSNYSQQFQVRLQELLDRIMRGEKEIEAFHSFSERVVSYLRRRIDEVTKGLTFVSSKRTN